MTCACCLFDVVCCVLRPARSLSQSMAGAAISVGGKRKTPNDYGGPAAPQEDIDENGGCGKRLRVDRLRDACDACDAVMAIASPIPQESPLTPAEIREHLISFPDRGASYNRDYDAGFNPEPAWAEGVDMSSLAEMILCVRPITVQPWMLRVFKFKSPLHGVIELAIKQIHDTFQCYEQSHQQGQPAFPTLVHDTYRLIERCGYMVLHLVDRTRMARFFSVAGPTDVNWYDEPLGPTSRFPLSSLIMEITASPQTKFHFNLMLTPEVDLPPNKPSRKSAWVARHLARQRMRVVALADDQQTGLDSASRIDTDTFADQVWWSPRDLSIMMEHFANGLIGSVIAHISPLVHLISLYGIREVDRPCQEDLIWDPKLEMPAGVRAWSERLHARWDRNRSLTRDGLSDVIEVFGDMTPIPLRVVTIIRHYLARCQPRHLSTVNADPFAAAAAGSAGQLLPGVPS